MTEVKISANNVILTADRINDLKSGKFKPADIIKNEEKLPVEDKIEKVSVGKKGKISDQVKLVSGEAKESIKSATEFSAKNVSKKILTSGLVGIPLDFALNSFEYHSGKADAKEYTAKSLDGFFNWSAFEAGMIATCGIAAKLTGKGLSPFGKTSVGVGMGLVASAIYHKTVGKKVEEGLKEVIPAKVAEPIAKTMDKYFAKPIDDYVLQPIKNHPKTSIAIGGLLATALTFKYPVAFGKNILLGFVSASAIGVAGNMGLNLIMPEKKVETQAAPKKEIKLPSVDTPVTKEETQFAIDLEKKYNSPEKDKITPEDVARYNNVSDRLDFMSKKIQK